MSSDGLQKSERTLGQHTEDVPFAPPPFPYRIKDALRIVIPYLDEQEDPPTVDGSRVANTLLSTITSDHVDTLVLWIFPGNLGINYIISGSLAHQPSQLTGQQTLRDNSAFSVLKRWGKQYIPDSFGLERVNVDLSPLGRRAAHVSRLATKKDQQLKTKYLKYNPLERVLRALHTQRDPYVYQFIISGGSDSVTATARLATFAPRHITRSDRAFAKICTEGHQRDLTNVYQPSNATSNERLDVSDYYDIEYKQDSGESPGYRVQYSNKVSEPDYRYRQTEQEADELYDLVTGVKEYEPLLRASANYSNLYERLGVYPRFSLRGPQVENFAALVPLSEDISLWNEVANRDQPQISTLNVIQEADGTQQGLATGTDTSPSQSETNVITTGNFDHEATVVGAESWFGELGDQIEKIAQDTSALPDLILYPTDGQIVSIDFDLERELTETDILPSERDLDTSELPVEVEHKNEAAGTLSNAAQAAINDQMVLFICTTESKLEDVVGWLRTPYKKSTEAGAFLHETGTNVVCEDGTEPVLPVGVDSDWISTPNRRLQLFNNGDLIAEGPAHAHPKSFEFDTPVYEQKGSQHIVKLDGEIIETYNSYDEFKSDWNRIYVPHVPVEHSYLERALAYYVDPESDHFELVRYDVDPDWNVTDDMERYEDMVGSVAERLLVSSDASELELDQWRNRLLRLYRRQTDRKEPTPGKIGEAMSETETEFDTKQRNDPYRQIFTDHTFVYPEGTVSAAIPGVTTDDAGVKDWAGTN